MSNAAGSAGNSSSSHPAISADGCKVVFESDATNLVSGDVNGRRDVFLRQRCTTPPQTLLVSLDGAGEQGANGSDEADISADGNYVVFSFGGSAATLEGLYLRDLRTGVVQCISVNQTTSKCESARKPAISADGSRVAFWSFTPLLSSDINGVWDIYLYDRNAVAPISIVSVSATGQQRTQGNESTSRIVAPAISANGRYVAFATTSNSLVANDTNGFQDVFVKDILTGNVIRASVSTSGAEGNGNSPIGQGERPSLSADGTWVVFSSSASNLTPRSASGSNIVAHNILTGQSIDFVPPSRFGIGSQTVVSGDSLGRFVVFFASDSLDQRFGKSGIFVHDRTTHCLLNFAESFYPGLFAPATGSSQVLTPYIYRAYSNSYLGISVADDHVYHLVPATGNGPSDLGVLTNYLDVSGCR